MRKKFLWGLCLSLLAACGTDPSESQEAEDVQVAASALAVAPVLTPAQASLNAKLNGILEIFKGRSVDEAFAAVKADIPDAEESAYKSAILWNFWKAHNGKNFDNLGRQIPALGAERRKLLVGGVCLPTLPPGETVCSCEKANHCTAGVVQTAQPLITEARANANLKAVSFKVDAGINKLFALTRKEVTGSTLSVPFLVYSDLTRLSATDKAKFESELVRIGPKINALLPPEHSASLDVIFIVDELASRSKGGGGYSPPSTAKNWKDRRATLVPRMDVHDFAVNRGRGIIGITTNAILSRSGDGSPSSAPELTLIHESGHSVNENYARIQPSTPNGNPSVTVMDYAGLKYPRGQCPSTNPNCERPFASVMEYAAEAYSNYFIKKKDPNWQGPSFRVCRTDADPPKPANESWDQCEQRILKHLDNSPAFQDPVQGPIP